MAAGRRSRSRLLPGGRGRGVGLGVVRHALDVEPDSELDLRGPCAAGAESGRQREEEDADVTSRWPWRTRAQAPSGKRRRCSTLAQVCARGQQWQSARRRRPARSPSSRARELRALPGLSRGDDGHRKDSGSLARWCLPQQPGAGGAGGVGRRKGLLEASARPACSASGRRHRATPRPPSAAGGRTEMRTRRARLDSGVESALGPLARALAARAAGAEINRMPIIDAHDASGDQRRW
jgi:hypothetical protein